MYILGHATFVATLVGLLCAQPWRVPCDVDVCWSRVWLKMSPSGYHGIHCCPYQEAPCSGWRVAPSPPFVPSAGLRGARHRGHGRSRATRLVKVYIVHGEGGGRRPLPRGARWPWRGSVGVVCVRFSFSACRPFCPCALQRSRPHRPWTQPAAAATLGWTRVPCGTPPLCTP